MNLILHISSVVLTVGGALIVLLGVVAMFYIIGILAKINYILGDMKEKYKLFTGFVFKPLQTIRYFINKYNK